MNLKKLFINYCNIKQLEINSSQIKTIEAINEFYQNNFNNNLLANLFFKKKIYLVFIYKVMLV